MRKKILVTGAFGYLGGRLVDFLSTDSKLEIIVASARNQTSKKLPSNCLFKKIDWDSEKSLNEICNGVDTILHTAGMNASDCYNNPADAFIVNCSYTSMLLKAALKKDVNRFIYFSTAHIYSSALIGEFTESSLITNNHPYATSHLAGENVLNSLHNQNKIEGIVIRLSNSFGPPIFNDVNCWKLFVNDICMQAVIKNNITINSYANQRRNFVPISLVCEIILHLMQVSIKSIGNGIINVGTEWNPTLLEMASKVKDRVELITKKEISIIANEKSSEDMFLNYNINKLIHSGFNISSMKSIDTELDNLIKYCIANKF